MKKTGSEMTAADDSPTDRSESVEIIDRARLQADVAQQRVRLAKDELRRARKRLKEAKREARRARKYAVLARKDWKRARRQADKEGPLEARPDVVVARTARKPLVKSKPGTRVKAKTRAGTASRSRRTTARPPAKRTRRTSKSKGAR